MFSAENKRRLIQALGLVLCIAGAYLLISYLMSQSRIRTVNEEISALHESAAVTTPQPEVTPQPTAAVPEKFFHRADGEMLTVAKELRGINPDYAGWLRIDGIVDLPVVYKDNSTYLDTDFYGSSSRGGTLFFDVHNPPQATTQQLIIHGHNMKDGSMFGICVHYADKDFAMQHRTATLETLYEKESYSLLMVAYTEVIKTDEDFVQYCGRSTFASEEDFFGYIGELTDCALLKTDIDLCADDALLTLSTCMNDGRLLIVFRKDR